MIIGDFFFSLPSILIRKAAPVKKSANMNML